MGRTWRLISSPLRAPVSDIWLVSDYGTNVCTRNLLRILGRRAHAANVPILVDPDRYRNWKMIRVLVTEARFEFDGRSIILYTKLGERLQLVYCGCGAPHMTSDPFGPPVTKAE